MNHGDGLLESDSVGNIKSIRQSISPVLSEGVGDGEDGSLKKKKIIKVESTG